MKAWRDLKSVPLPLHMRKLKRDARGYPIPFVVMIDAKGAPHFRVMDTSRTAQALGQRRCSVCGSRMSGALAFVGGPLSMANRLFTDAAMHRECAVYALRVCPMLAAPRFAFARSVSEIEGAAATHVIDVASDVRPERYGLGMAESYQLAQVRGEAVIHASPWLEPVQWWRHGEIVEVEAIS